jgi:tetratricopeptide (TPR) repeat protein
VWERATEKQVAVWQEEDRTAEQHVAELRQRQELKPNALSRAQNGRWAEAAADLAQAIEYSPDDRDLWFWLGAIYVQAGQLDAYREHCRKSLERFRETTDPSTADQIAKDCLILPDSGADLDTISKMADTAIAQGRQSPWFPSFQFCKGLAEYRQGRFASAADWMEKVLTNAGSFVPRDIEAYLVLAMSQCQLQEVENARASLAKGAEIEHNLGSGDSDDAVIDSIITHALMREAKAMIEPTPAKP